MSNGISVAIRESVHPLMPERIIIRVHNSDIVFGDAVLILHSYFSFVLELSRSLLRRWFLAIEPRLQAQDESTPVAHLGPTSDRHPHVPRVHESSAVLAKEADLRLEKHDNFLARHIRHSDGA